MPLCVNHVCSSAQALWKRNFQPRELSARSQLTGKSLRLCRVFCVHGNEECGTGFTSGFSQNVSSSNQRKRFNCRNSSSKPKASCSARTISYSFYDISGCRNVVKRSCNLIVNIKTREGSFIRCSIDVPNYKLPETDSVGNINGDHKNNLTAECRNKTDARERVKAAFFDVDGTITQTNVVLAYLVVRMSELSLVMKILWIPFFAIQCLFYLLVDNFDRATFNRVFYCNHYKGRPVHSKDSMATLIYERYYKPRIFAGALKHIKELKQLGYHIVLVTGALDFQVAPLAQELGADYVYAAELVEENGRFTGKLNGMATSNDEKAERVLDYAKRFDVSLKDSLAFGDSIADISMLEMVGRPHAVNPDARLLAIALQRKWTVLAWTLQTLKATTAPAVRA